MSQNIGTLITAAIRPNDTLDLIASAYSNEILGGHHTYATIAERNAIMTVRRQWGMLCTVYNDPTPSNNKTYILQYGYSDTNITNNLNWNVFSGSGGGNGGGSGEWQSSVLTRLDDPTLLSPTGGDRYLIKSIPLGDWSTNPDKIAEWDYNIATWSYTTPTNGMTVRVDDEDNSIYKYEGTYSSGTWQKEYISSVRFVSATTSNGLNYYCVSDPIFNTYSTNQLFNVVVSTDSFGGVTTMNINGVGNVVIKKDLGNGSLVDINTNDLRAGIVYPMYFDGTYFQVTLAQASQTGIIGNKYIIDTSETLIIPVNSQYWIYGDLTVKGTLTNYGELIIANGSLVIDGGLYSNYGTVTMLGVQTGGSSVGERVNITDRFLSALDTTTDGDQACATPITNSPKNNSYVSVVVNGVEYQVGDGVKTTDCYFSGDGGVSAKSFSSSHPNGKILSGDLLYWNGSIAGIELQSIWKISFNYIY